MNSFNYIKSNNTKLPIPIDLVALEEAKRQYKEGREAVSMRTDILQDLSDSILRAFGLDPVRIVFEGTQPCRNKPSGSLRSKILGSYRMSSQAWIKVYRFTAKREKLVSAKTAISTLIHEIGHHIDAYLLNIVPTIHTAGFYIRIGDLERLLKQ